MTVCPNPVGYWVSQDTIYPMPCGKPDCPHCGKVYRAKILHRVDEGFKPVLDREGYARMMTLTLGESAISRNIGKYFARFRQHLYKNHGIKLEYFWTREWQPGKNHKLHMHVLIDQFLPHHIAKASWIYATYGTSSIVDFRGSKDTGIYNPAGYMMKYLTKATAEKLPYGMRRYGFSQGIAANYKAAIPKAEQSEKFFPALGADLGAAKNLQLAINGECRLIPKRKLYK